MVRNSILATNNPVRLVSRIKAGHEVYVCPHTDCVNAGSWTGLAVWAKSSGSLPGSVVKLITIPLE